MKILIAPQAFKGTISNVDACHALNEGIKQLFPNSQTILFPMADGGDGTLNAILKLEDSHFYSTVRDSLGRRVLAPWGFSPATQMAVIELASICGLQLLKPEKYDPINSSTYGVGEILREALDKGYRRFFIGIGGSATQDAGVGIAQALGVRLLDAAENELPPGGAALERLDRIDCTGLDERIRQSEIIVGCDVMNPLIGLLGTSCIYAPQKGATPTMVARLEAAMVHFAEVVRRDLHIDIASMPMGGAAGGAGAGMAAFLGAKLVLASEYILDQVGFDRHLEGADFVVTGEGCLDGQTAFHKGVYAVAMRAKKMGVPVIAIVGSLGEGYEKMYGCGISKVVTLDSSLDYKIALIQAVKQSLQ